MKRPSSLDLSAADTLGGEAPSRYPKRIATLAASWVQDEHDWIAILHQSKAGYSPTKYHTQPLRAAAP